MPIRLVLMLLLALAALPQSSASAAACHEAMPMTMAAMADHHQTPREATAPHSCIGCIPPADWLRERVVAPVTAERPDPVVAIVRLDLRGASPPASPPPRAA